MIDIFREINSTLDQITKAIASFELSFGDSRKTIAERRETLAKCEASVLEDSCAYIRRLGRSLCGLCWRRFRILPDGTVLVVVMFPSLSAFLDAEEAARDLELMTREDARVIETV